MNGFIFEMMNRRIGDGAEGKLHTGTTVSIINHVDAWCGKIETAIGELTDFLPYGSDSPLNQLLLRGIVNKINTLISALRKMTRDTWSWKLLPETISNRIRK